MKTIEEIDINALAPYDEQAKELNVRQFAERHHKLLEIKLWGNPACYSCVNVDGTNYLWNLTDGKYDGWERKMDEPIN